MEAKRGRSDPNSSPQASLAGGSPTARAHKKKKAKVVSRDSSVEKRLSTLSSLGSSEASPEPTLADKGGKKKAQPATPKGQKKKAQPATPKGQKKKATKGSEKPTPATSGPSGSGEGGSSARVSGRRRRANK